MCKREDVFELNKIKGRLKIKIPYRPSGKVSESINALHTLFGRLLHGLNLNRGSRSGLGFVLVLQAHGTGRNDR